MAEFFRILCLQAKIRCGKLFMYNCPFYIHMGRKKGFDEKKIGSIIGILASNPDGLWLRRIASELKLSPTTVTKYVDGILKPLVEDVSLGGSGKPLLRVIRLKPFVIERLAEGKDIRQIMKMLDLMRRIG